MARGVLHPFFGCPCNNFYWELMWSELISWEVDLVGVDLMGVDLVGVDFVGVDLVGMNLSDIV